MPEFAALSSPLTAVTHAVDNPGNLLAHTLADHPLAFIRDGDGIVGLGEAVRYESTGRDRIRDASTFWSELSARASVTDPIRRPGSGLVAFGAFSFDDESTTPSALVVPRVVIGRRDGQAWVTTIAPAGDPHPHVPSFDTPPLGGHISVTFRAGRIDADAYAASVEQAIARIDAGEAQKIVLARDRIGELPAGADLRIVLTDLARAYPQCVTFAVDGVLGATPETLARTSRGILAARVLAGSAARGTDPESDIRAGDALAASAKDHQEHEYAIRSLVDALAPIAADIEVSEQPFLLQLPNLWHLASDVRATLPDGTTSLDAAAALHPTAAVAGTPTTAALAAIRTIEHVDRGRYAGPVGWVGTDGDGEWMLALRSAEVTAGTIRAWAGAGIVAASSPASEVAETELKLRPIIEALH